ncbi:sulfotransferase [Candidatus Pelagibacter ubique]|jgi:hypothetical protein|nr:sulfotransferase [Candidatus Pelagibacter ubique]
MFDKNKKKLNVMILGGDRSGTTWIHGLCAQHADIFVCPGNRREFLSKQEFKKKRFFSKLKFNCPLDNHKNEKIILGMRNMQIYHDFRMAKMYFDYDRNIKFILSLRNPIERTISSYQVRVKKLVSNGLKKEIFDINSDITKEQPYVQRSLIYSMLESYLDYFPKKNFFIFPIEKVNKNPNEWMNNIFSFLEIEKNNNLDYTKVSSNQRNVNSKIKFVSINEETKKKIVHWCLEDILKLSDLSKMDLVKYWNLER